MNSIPPPSFIPQGGVPICQGSHVKIQLSGIELERQLQKYSDVVPAVRVTVQSSVMNDQVQETRAIKPETEEQFYFDFNEQLTFSVMTPDDIIIIQVIDTKLPRNEDNILHTHNF